MKTKFTSLIGIAAFAVATLTFAGCQSTSAQIGATPSAPTKVEQFLFDTETNFTPKVTVVSTVQTLTNSAGIAETSTNTALETNLVPVYTQTVKPATTATVEAAGAALNVVMPGVGSMVSMGVLAVLGLWAHLRSRKNGDTSAVLAQQVETMRTFIQTLPNGTRYDTAITAWLQSHQLETGTASTVLKLLETKVSNPDAQAAVKEIAATIDALNAPATPV